MHELTRSDDGEAVISKSNYDKLVCRGRINVLRPGKGLGSYALIEYHSLPERFRLRFEAKYGNPEKIMKQEDMPLAVDSEAQKYYHEYLLPNGEHLPGPASRDDRKHYDSLPPRHRPTASARASLLLLCFRNIPSLRCSRSRAGIAPGNAFSVRGKIAIFVLPTTKFQRLCYLPIYISISFARRNN